MSNSSSGWKRVRTLGLAVLAAVLLLCGADGRSVHAETPRYAGLGVGASGSGVSLGKQFGCAVGLDGKVRCWGANGSGQLGSGTTGGIDPSPAPVVNLDEVISVTTGWQHACALRRDGTVWCWGDNTYGQLGDGGNESASSLPVKVAMPNDLRVVSVAAGFWHTCAVGEDRFIYCWGDNQYDELGTGSTTPSMSSSPVNLNVTATRVFSSDSSAWTCALLDSGTVDCWGLDPAGEQAQPTPVAGLSTNISAVATGDGAGCALLESGQVQCWGDNSYGELGYGDTQPHSQPVTVVGVDDATELSVGENHACVRESDGAYRCWGGNGLGQIGLGGTGSAEPTPVPSASGGWAHIYAGYEFTCAATADGKLECWGDNSQGELGDPSQCNGFTCSPFYEPQRAITFNEAPNVPTPVGTNFTGGESISSDLASACIRLADGRVQCWGDNNAGQLGDGTNTSRSAAADVYGLDSSVVSVGVGFEHACALIDDGTVKCWGDDAYYELGDGQTNSESEPQTVPNLSDVVALKVNWVHTCALLVDGSVECWGYNFATSSYDTVPTPVEGGPYSSLFAGALDACAIEKGKAYCWGDNSWGELGTGGVSTATPVQVPGLSDVGQIALGVYHSCADVAGQRYCWGENDYGQYGDGETSTSLTPALIGDYPAPVSAGNDYTCDTWQEELWCAGANGSGQLGTGDYNSLSWLTLVDDQNGDVHPRTFDAGWNTPCVIEVDGAIRCWGDNTYGQAGSSPAGGSLTTPTAVANLPCVTGVDDGNPCTYNTCDTSVGILHAPEPNTVSCSNDICNPATCNGNGACVLGPPTDATCCNSSGYVAQGTKCGGDVCSPMICDDTGHCVAGTPTPLTGDSNGCTTEECDPATGDTLHIPNPSCFGYATCNGTSCPSGLVYDQACNCVSSFPSSGADISASDIDPDVPASGTQNDEFVYSNCGGAGQSPCAETGVNRSLSHPGVITGTVVTNIGGKNDANFGGVTVSTSLRNTDGTTTPVQSVTRDDGRFDLAVDGGENYLVKFERDGYVTAERWVTVPWNDYAAPVELRMVAEAPAQQVTPGTAQPVVAPTTPADPSEPGVQDRKLVLALPSGLTMNGSSAQVNLHLTEITTGSQLDQGEAMPGPLPPTSAYTYAVDISADGSPNGITLNEPVAMYVKSFITNSGSTFPEGTQVPAAYWDTTKGAWIPAQSGVVLKITSVDSTNQVVTAYSNSPTCQNCVNPLNLTQDELKAMYQAYDSNNPYVWRVVDNVGHFCSWDFNFSGGSVPKCTTPSNTTGGLCSDPTITTDTPLPSPCETGHSIIECQNQVLGESVPIPGTGLSLNYRSSRAFGHAASRRLHIQLFDPSQPPTAALEIDWEVDVAGRAYRHQIDRDSIAYPNKPNLPSSVDFDEWDGKDVFGRKVNGEQDARVTIMYAFPTDYTDAATFGDTGLHTLVSAPDVLIGYHDHAVSAVRYTFTEPIGNWQAPTDDGLGGWTLSAHDTYDPRHQVVYYGTGERRTVDALAKTVQAFAGPFPASGGQWGAAAAPDGTVYLSDGGNPGHVYAVSTDGTVTTVAGGGNGSLANLNTADPPDTATSVNLQNPVGLAVGSDGSLYIASNTDQLVLRVSNMENPDSSTHIITTVAGTYNSAGDSGDENPATSATLNYPKAVAVAPDGTLYIGESGAPLVRRVDPAGYIHAYAGNGTEGCTGDHVPAISAELGWVNALALGPDGSLYIADTEDTVRKVLPNGTIEFFAGDCGNNDGEDDGKAPTSTDFRSIFGLAVGPDDTVYASADSRARAVKPGEPVFSVLGNGTSQVGQDGILATASSIESPAGLAVLPDGSLVVADDAGSNGDLPRVRIVRNQAEGTLSETEVPSKDGSTYDVFDQTGKELSLNDAETGTVLLKFHYDDALHPSWLTSISDPFGSTGGGTTVEIDRDTPAPGETEIVAKPSGLTTTLTLDSNNNNYLEAIQNPNDEEVDVAMDANGMLQSFTDARTHRETFQYDSEGRLAQETDVAGRVQNFSRTDLGDTHDPYYSDYKVQQTYPFDDPNPNNLSRTFEVSSTPTQTSPVHADTDTRTVSNPDGTSSTSIAQRDGVTDATLADGTTVESVETPDPYYGMALPQDTVTTTLPDGSTSRTVAYTRTETRSNGVLESQTRQVVLNPDANGNGPTFKDNYTASNNTELWTSAENRETQATLDTYGRVTDLAWPNTVFDDVTYDYSDSNNLDKVHEISQGTRHESFGYDSSTHFLDTITDPLNEVTTLAHDGAGRVTQVTLPDTNAIGLQYDGNGNLVSVTPPGQPAHWLFYTPANLLEADVPPAVDDSGGNSGTGYTLYTWDTSRRLTRLDRPDKSSVILTYDDTQNDSSGGGKLSGVDLDAPDGSKTESLAYTYFTSTDSTGHAGQLKTASGPDLATPETVSFQHDGPLVSKESWSGPVTGDVEWTYNNNNFEINTESVDGGNQVAYGYDNDGLVTSVGPLTITRDASAGTVTEEFSGAADVKIVSTYNAYGELASRTVTASGKTVYSAVYDSGTDPRDALGRPTHILETVGDTKERDTSVKYWPRGWLKSMDGVSYNYGPNGNRTDGTYDAQDRLLTLGSNSYTYTPNGELSTKTDSNGTTSYHYDALGNLNEVDDSGGTTVTYVTDALGRRVQKSYDGSVSYQLLYRDGLRPIAMLDDTGAVLVRFVYADGTPPGSGAGSTLYTRLGVPSAAAGAGGPSTPAYLVTPSDGTVYAIVTDQLGSPRLFIDTGTGTVAAERQYDAWGNFSTIDFVPIGFAGGLYDPDTGLERFGARDYDPESGRWTAPDPMGFGGGQANIYEYVADDPVDWRDPSGRFLMMMAAGGLIGAAAQAWTNYDAYNSGCISGRDYALSIAAGVVVGAFATLPTGIIGGAVAGSVGGGADYIVNLGIGATHAGLAGFAKSLVGGAVGGAFANGVGTYFKPTDEILGLTLGPLPPKPEFGQVGGAVGTLVGNAAATWWDQ